MKATPADQRRLLDVADLDSRIQRSDRARKNPPQAERVKQLVAERQVLSQELSVRLGVRDDLTADIRRIESDVAVVDARRARDTERLSSTSSAKDAQGLESELASLARRKSELEDAELDLMDRLEQAEAAVAEQEALIAGINDEGARVSAEAKAAVAEATTSFEAATRDRAAVVGELPADLVAYYEKVALRSSGAALLRRGTCEGCRMVLAGTDMNVLRRSTADDIVTCPECGCILVRTEESGL